MPVMTNTLPQWTRLRLRQSAHLRDLCSEISFTRAHLIQPVFIVEGLETEEPIAGLDGNSRLGLDAALDTIGRDVDAGVGKALTLVELKDGLALFVEGLGDEGLALVHLQDACEHRSI